MNGERHIVSRKLRLLARCLNSACATSFSCLILSRVVNGWVIWVPLVMKFLPPWLMMASPGGIDVPPATPRLPALISINSVSVTCIKLLSFRIDGKYELFATCFACCFSSTV